MRKMNLKIIILTGVLVVAMLLLGAPKSQAVLQANATTHNSPASKTGVAWITEIRQMETTGQTMGLNETLDGLNATSESNHIDVHMMLPTEYGAVAILSASGYGNVGKLRDETNAQQRTTTGNSTGVYFTGDRWELIAATQHFGISKYNLGLSTAVGSIACAEYGAGWHSGKVLNAEDFGLGSTYYRYGYMSVAAGGAGIFSQIYAGVDGKGSADSYWKNGKIIARGTATIGI